MDKRYNLHSDRTAQLLSLRGYGLGQSLCAGLEHGEKHGCRPMPQVIGNGLELWSSSHLFNTDQGSQYTSSDWQKAIRAEGIQISMDGKGRWADNIIMERFWRTYKHEFFLHREPRNLDEANEMTAKWLEYYNRERPHSSLHNKSPLQYREESGNPLPANFWRDFSAPAQLAALRAAPSLRSGRRAYATKSRQKWIDIRGYRMI